MNIAVTGSRDITRNKKNNYSGRLTKLHHSTISTRGHLETRAKVKDDVNHSTGTPLRTWLFINTHS